MAIHNMAGEAWHTDAKANLPYYHHCTHGGTCTNCTRKQNL